MESTVAFFVCFEQSLILRRICLLNAISFNKHCFLKIVGYRLTKPLNLFFLCIPEYAAIPWCVAVLILVLLLLVLKLCLFVVLFPAPVLCVVASSSDNLTKATMINKLFCLRQEPAAYPQSFAFVSALLSLPALLVLCSCINKLVFNFIKLFRWVDLWDESF